jgi:hypothetical protein
MSMAICNLLVKTSSFSLWSIKFEELVSLLSVESLILVLDGFIVALMICTEAKVCTLNGGFLRPYNFFPLGSLLCLVHCVYIQLQLVDSKGLWIQTEALTYKRMKTKEKPGGC